jgi:hypothetical protein
MSYYSDRHYPDEHIHLTPHINTSTFSIKPTPIEYLKHQLHPTHAHNKIHYQWDKGTTIIKANATNIHNTCQ